MLERAAPINSKKDTFKDFFNDSLPGMTDSKLCPIRWMLDRIGERWSLYVLMALFDRGPSRFSELSSSVGANISNRMLSRTLDTLEENQLVVRSERGHVTFYALTEQGASLMTPMRSLMQWVIDNAKDLDRGRRKFGLPPLDLPPGLVPDEAE